MVDSDPVLDGSKRFKKFRESLIKMIPRLPNNKKSLTALRSKSHTDLLIIYMCWRLRHVAVRPRKVIGLSVLKDDLRFEALEAKIEAFTKAIEDGADLGPYLSKRAHREGYMMDLGPKNSNTTTWEDKDFLLNALGLHHFHLGSHREANGLMARTDEVVFAHVSRDTVEIFGLFDHSVFEWTIDDVMVPERQRLWSTYNEYRSVQAEPGTILIGGIGGLGITSAGTPAVVTMKAIRLLELVREIDPRLDDAEYEWHYDHLDFGLRNQMSGDFKCLMPGPN